MKFFLKIALKHYLKLFAKLAILIHRPVVIAIAGSLNKSFAKDAVLASLGEKGIAARANQNNFNTEIGLPLAILDLQSGYNSIRNWLPIVLSAPRAIFQKLPTCLVLSLGISDPGDMPYLLKIIKPKIAIITDISQRYLESFSDMDMMLREYEHLVKCLPSEGAFIYNADNPRIKQLKKYSAAQNIGFGWAEEAEYRIENLEKTRQGQSLIIRNQKGKRIPKFISRFGDHQAKSALISEIIGDYALFQ